MSETAVMSPTWDELAEALGLASDTQVYPVRTICPICSAGRLTVYPDVVKQVYWHHCTGCGSQGDMIQLAATCWKTNLEGAEARLALTIPPRAPRAGVLSLPRFQALWSAAQKRLTAATLGPLVPLLRRHKLSSRLNDPEFQRAFGLLYGVATRALVERALSSHGPMPEERGDFELSWGDSTNGNRPYELIHPNRRTAPVFAGKEWGSLLFVPYFDLPGRVTAFFCVGRGGRPEDLVYMSLPDKQHEFGLAGLAALPAATANYGRHVFAVDDPLLMLRLQNRNFNTSTRPLPIVAWHDSPRGATRRAWATLENRPVVFWAPRPDVRVVRQAMVADGLLAVFGPEDPAKLDDYLRDTPAADLLKRAQKRALPWRDVVREWETTRPDLHARIVTELDATDTNKVLDCCSVRSAEFVSATRAVLTRSVVYNNTIVTEHPDGRWTGTQTHGKRSNNPGRESLICDASLRITEIEFRPRGVRCHGHVRFRGEDLPFTAMKSEIAASPFHFMEKVAIKNKKGILGHRRGWSKNLYELALLFHSPKPYTDKPGFVVSNRGRRGEPAGNTRG
jgi:hypothetical protein